MTTSAYSEIAMASGEDAPFTPAEREADFWIRWFVVIEVLTQLAVISPLGSARTLLRMAAFSSSLVFLVLVRGRGGMHPARNVILLIGIWLVLCVFYPTAAIFPAAGAQFALYFSILSPIFWVPRLAVTGKTLRRLLVVMWMFYAAGSAVGVLQVYFPGRFQPNVSPVILALGHGYIESLKIVTSGGVRVFRPMGLTDVPGGAATSGLYAVVLGIGFFLTAKQKWLSAVAVASVLLGLTCLYLSQVRALMVITGVSIVGFTVVLAMRRDYKRLTWFSVVIGAVLVASFRGAVSLAKTSVESRVETLTSASPTAVYQANRGMFLEQAFEELLPEYPLGAGMGRWGMMNSYFGDRNNPKESLWAEIQWNGWILDGGAPLVLLYVWALVVTVMMSYRIARMRLRSDPGLALWAAVIVGYSLGTCALTFSYPVFVSQSGLEFWLLNAAVFTAGRTQAYHDMQAGQVPAGAAT